MIWLSLALAQDEARQPWGPAAEEALPPKHGDRPEDYDGRAKEPATAGETLLWVPRVALSPLYGVERYVLYPPIRALSIWSEKNNIPVRIASAFTVVDDQYRLRIYPTTLFDFGFRTSVGVHAGVIGRDAPHHIGSVQAAWGGPGWAKVQVKDTISLAADGYDGDSDFAGSRLTADVHWVDRPDNILFLAPGQRVRFGRERLGGGIDLFVRFPEYLALDFDTGIERNRFGDGAPVFGDTPIQTRIDPDILPGWEGYTLADIGAGLAFDTRKARPEEGSGLRFDIHETVAVKTREADALLLRTDVETSLFWDVSGRNHVLGLSHYAAVSRGRGGVVPFGELATLGGPEHMRGFWSGWFRDGGVMSAALQFDYPVWVYTDATLFAEMGGAFDADFTDLDVGAMAMSFGTGIKTISRRDTYFQFLLAVGTSPLAEDTSIDSFNLVLGTNRGF